MSFHVSLLPSRPIVLPSPVRIGFTEQYMYVSFMVADVEEVAEVVELSENIENMYSIQLHIVTSWFLLKPKIIILCSELKLEVTV